MNTVDDNNVPPSLVIRVEAHSDGLVVFVGGELDMASKGRLASTVAQHQRPGDVRLVIDMTELEFMDSTGLSDIINIAAQTTEARLTVRGAQPQVRQVFEITGLSHFLEK